MHRISQDPSKKPLFERSILVFDQVGWGQVRVEAARAIEEVQGGEMVVGDLTKVECRVDESESTAATRKQIRWYLWSNRRDLAYYFVEEERDTKTKEEDACKQRWGILF